MIITNEHQLRLPCEKASLEEADKIIEQLHQELKLSSVPGVGLAAPQIGIQKRVAVVVTPNRSVNLVNPVIVEKLNPIIFEGEGCLSFPNMMEKTKRYDEIVVEQDIEPKRFIATGFIAVVIQHEIDHINNILLPDIAIKDKVKNKVRPNDPCSCGSKVKYKKCCGKGK